MWEVIEVCSMIAAVIIIGSQIIIPGFIPKLRFFWLFRRTNQTLRRVMDQTLELEEEDKITELRNRLTPTARQPITVNGDGHGKTAYRSSGRGSSGGSSGRDG